MENKGIKKKNGDIPESTSSAKQHMKSPQGKRSPSEETPKVHLMSRAGSRTRKYEERRRVPVPVPAAPPVWAPAAPAPVTLNRHRAMPKPTTHAGQYPDRTPYPVEAYKRESATSLPSYGASSSTNRTNGMFGANISVEECESCSCSFYPNVSVNSKDAFFFGDKYCSACLLGFQRKG